MAHALPYASLSGLDHDLYRRPRRAEDIVSGLEAAYPLTGRQTGPGAAVQIVDRGFFMSPTMRDGRRHPRPRSMTGRDRTPWQLKH